MRLLLGSRHGTGLGEWHLEINSARYVFKCKTLALTSTMMLDCATNDGRTRWLAKHVKIISLFVTCCCPAVGKQLRLIATSMDHRDKTLQALELNFWQDVDCDSKFWINPLCLQLTRQARVGRQPVWRTRHKARRQEWRRRGFWPFTPTASEDLATWSVNELALACRWFELLWQTHKIKAQLAHVLNSVTCFHVISV